MPIRPQSPDEKYPFARRISELQASLRAANPHQLAEKTGALFLEDKQKGGVFQLSVLGDQYRISYPTFEPRAARAEAPAPLGVQGIVLYYFDAADGAPLAQRWVSFTELPDGRFYNPAFQGYSGRLLAKRFGRDLPALQCAVDQIGGRALTLQDGEWPGDHAFVIQALPRLPLLVAFWEGDEDFAASIQVLFDASAPHYLPTDVNAILGGMLARKLMRPLNT